MSPPGLLILGAGGHAQACIEVVERTGAHETIKLIGCAGEVGRHVLNYEVIGTDVNLPSLVYEFPYALVGVGQIHSADRRIKLFNKLRTLGFKLPTIISPTAVISRNAVIGAGTIVMHGAIIGPGACVGQNCIINSGALIEHGCMVEDHCHIATRAILNGEVRVGVGSFVGSASVTKERVVIGRGSLVGMGSCLRKDLADGGVFY